MIYVPTTPVEIKQPPASPTEAEKFANKGQYFLDMNRWIVYNSYNRYRVPFSDFVPNVTGELGLANGIVEEILNNYRFYYQYQGNPVFEFMTKTSTGDVPAVWRNGGYARQLCDHIIGNIAEMVAPMQKNISAESISKHSVLKKKDIFDKIELAAAINPILEEAGAPAFQPMGGKNYSNKKDYSDAMREAREDLEKDATIIARNLFYVNNCKTEFVENDARDAVVANLVGTHITERNGQVLFESIPSYNCIYDFSSKGQYGDGAMYGGFVVPISYEEACAEFPNMPKEVRDELYQVMNYTQADFNIWSTYWNAPFQNVQWWYNNQKFFSKSVVYWLEKKDSRVQTKTTAFGSKKSRRIDDHKYYQVPREDGTMANTIGYEMKGDSSHYMVHYAVVYGNKYLMDYGYEKYQVRPAFDKRMPELPIKFFCPSKSAGYVRSIMSRLRKNQLEIDRLEFKIQQLTARDFGNVAAYMAEKFGENFTPKQLIDEVKSFGATALPSTGDEKTDAGGIKNMIEIINMAQDVSQYLALKREQEREMEMITSTPPPVLGSQTHAIGKGVQENTIAQSSLAMLSFYEGLNEFYRRKLQYGANKAKMIYATNPDTYILPVSVNETKILKATKDLRFEDLNVYLQVNDAIDSKNKNTLYSLLFNYSQNAGAEPLASAEALLRGLKLMQATSFNEVIEDLEQYIDQLKFDNEKAMQQQMLIEQQQQQFAVQSKQIEATQKQLADIYKTILSANLSGAWAVKNTEAKNMAQREDEVVIADGMQKQAQLDPTRQQANQPA